MATSTGREIEGPGIGELKELCEFFLNTATGLNLPEGTDASNLVERLAMLREVVEQSESDGSSQEELAASAAIPMSNGLNRGRPTKRKPTPLEIARNTQRILRRTGGRKR
ncbi:MAG: hypothetical protein M3552_03190 [Planctomycetota bacterium]|nr:hypothetical protein [Planctomycetaceae bacterium]MDQ3329651.1 hypothetical protein [Planctomycetota bacterium]